MSSGSEIPRPGTASGVGYREPLRPPWWWYPIAIGIAVLISAEFHMGGVPILDWLPYAILVPLAVGVIWSMGRSVLEIRGGEVRIRGAHIPLGYVSGAVALDALTLRRVVGREGDPAAFVCIRPWIGPGVQVWIDDPEDPTPYWVVSSRHPAAVVEALRRGR